MNVLPQLMLAESALSPWPLAATIVYALVGIGLSIVGYKLFDRCTPGDLHEEIVKNRNLAAALVGAAVILGVCGIVAAGIVG